MTGQMAYEASNKVREVGFTALPDYCCEIFQNIMKVGDNHIDRQKIIAHLYDCLCSLYGIPCIDLTVANASQIRKQYRNGSVAIKGGFYRPIGHKIVVYNKTAVRGQVVAIKHFVDIALHEFMHHYDVCKLGIFSTPHTSGFYNRIGDLKRKLLGA